MALTICYSASQFSGIDVEGSNQTGIDEIVDYIRHVYRHIDDLVKNVKCLLPMPIDSTIKKMAKSDRTIDDFLRDCAVARRPRRSSKTNTILDLPDMLTKTQEYQAAEELRRIQDITCCKWASAPGGRNTNDILRCKRQPQHQ
ncbi:hypothetical protein P7H17_27090 [Paenibacillus larvae]|nr:hypothetical protein [Paenibacillus larvae]MDT2288999.1 hypothetical protein [Paenibacillus larvae]